MSDKWFGFFLTISFCGVLILWMSMIDALVTFRLRRRARAHKVAEKAHPMSSQMSTPLLRSKL